MVSYSYEPYAWAGLEDATAVLDAFDVVKLGAAKSDAVFSRRSTATAAARTICVRSWAAEGETHRPAVSTVDRAIAVDERHDEVYFAWQCAQRLRSAYKGHEPRQGQADRREILAALPTCPIPEASGVQLWVCAMSLVVVSRGRHRPTLENRSRR